MVRKELLLVPADWKRPCEMDGCMEKSAYIAHSAQMPKNMGIYLIIFCCNLYLIIKIIRVSIIFLR